MTNKESEVTAEAEVQTDTVEETVATETEVSEEVATAATDEVASGDGVETVAEAALEEQPAEEVAYAPRPSDGQPV